ncbi:hypothetical protein D3C81_1927640 [compost metagenome]
MLEKVQDSALSATWYNKNFSATGSRHILEEDVATELEGLLRLRSPGRGRLHAGRVVVRGTAG